MQLIPVPQPLPADLEELRAQLVHKLACLQADYQRAAEPIIADLCRIEGFRPMPKYYIIEDKAGDYHANTQLDGS